MTVSTEPEHAEADLVSRLRQCIIERRIHAGTAILESHRPLLESLDPASPDAARIVWRAAQWVDVGWSSIAVVRNLLARFPAATRGKLPLGDYVCLRVAEGSVAMREERPDDAIAHFNTILQLEPDITDRELLAITNFWKARCKRQKGEYEDALEHAVNARHLALDCGFDRMAAVMRVLEAWLFFQKGKLKEALKTLAETEAALNPTDDALVLGNIQSTYGRIYRQEGRFDKAILHFTYAIDQYRKLGIAHPNLARTLANMAYVKRLVALETRRKIDAGVTRRRQAGERAPADSQDRERLKHLSEEAFVHLNEAESFYRIHPNHHGWGTVHLDRGLLHLDNGALDLAGQEAANAFVLGEEKQDFILMSRARILQSMIENAKLDEGIDDDPSRTAQNALDYVRDALEFARATQNRRLLARAHTWHGLTLANDFFKSHDAALEALHAASGFLDHGYHDTAWQDLQVLKTLLVRSNSMDETLRAWSRGAIGDKTFRQISDEFAEIIIPKIWEIEGRKIARVATRLSISPKKVRRALARAGLVGSAKDPATEG